MAYFACAKAGLTGTDKRTRASIAKGLVSPTFTTLDGQERLRGVVQLDLISGRNTAYITSKNLRERIRSARDDPRNYVATEPKAYVANLHDSTPGTIKTSTTLGLSKKAIITVLLGIGVVGYVVMR